MEKELRKLSENRVKIHTGSGEKLAGLHSQINFNLVTRLDSYILSKNCALAIERGKKESKLFKAATKEGLNIKDTRLKLTTLRLENPLTTKRSIIETALVDYFNKYPV